jgi:AAA+ superfamily predicted ATPase
VSKNGEKYGVPSRWNAAEGGWPILAMPQSNYDPALLRRISRHIEFKLPNQAMRVKLFELHLPNPCRVFADVNVLAAEAKGLSGGDILNVCVNAIYAGSTHDDPEKWMVTSEHLMTELRRVKTAKANHTGGSH